MKIVLAEVPYTKDRDISVEKSCVPEGAELTMAVFDEHAENNDAFYAEIKDADIIIDGYVHFGKKEIDAMDHCKVISFQSTGYNEADLDYAKEKGIAVCSILDYCTQETAESAMALMLNLQRGIRQPGQVLRCGAVMLVVEPIASIGEQEHALIERIRTSNAPAVLVINKIDTVEKPELLAVIAAYSEALPWRAIVPVSAQNGDGLEELFGELAQLAVPGPQLFPDDMISDMPEKQICAELVREKLLLCLDKEIPHGTAVEVTKFSERDNGIIDMDVTIYCEKESHKGIIIGKRGAMLKKIGELARQDIERFMGTKVYLQTWVKVKENWRDKAALVSSMGYKN